MVKRLSCLVLALCLVLGLLPVGTAAAAEVREDETLRNSDTEVCLGDWYYLVDAMQGGLVFRQRLPGQTVTCTDAEAELEPFTRTPAWQLLAWEGDLYAANESGLVRLDRETGAETVVLARKDPIDRFARTEDAFCYLSDGRLWILPDGQSRPTRLDTPEGILRFWLEDADHLVYMVDNETDQILELSTGTLARRADPASDLGDVPLYGQTSETRLAGISTLRQKYPAGKYWNHMPNLGTGPKFNNQEGWTNIPCPRHNNYCQTSRQSCNGFAPEDGVEISWQCMGYAEKCGFDVTGQSPRDGKDWAMLWNKDYLDSLKAGDIIRYRRNGLEHSIYVTAVYGDTIYFTDCNYNGTCVLRWDQTVSKSTVRASFIFLQSAPFAAPVEPTELVNVNCTLDGKHATETDGYATFDVWINGEEVETGVTDFYRYLMIGTQYEIRNVRPLEGVMYTGAGKDVLSGTVTAQTEVLLTLDHCIRGSDGTLRPVTFQDLPSPSHWSYPSIVWAIENEITGGINARTFAPEQGCTRAQALTFFWRAAGCPAPAAAEQPGFQDVRSTDYFFQPVLWALDRGITKGTTAATFSPHNTCTRAEIVTFLWRAAGSPSVSAKDRAALVFSDVAQSDYFYQAVVWAVKGGITKGTSASTFEPHKTCTRSEVLAFLYRSRP